MLSNSEGGATFSHPLWEQLRDRQDFFSGILAWSDGTFNLALSMARPKVERRAAKAIVNQQS